MWFESLSSVLRVVLVGTAAYILLIIFLRISGKRTLSKLNAFDLIVTVAMGSTLSSALISSDVALAEAAAAFLVLVVGQYVIAWLSVRSTWFANVVRSEPRILLWNGRFDEHALRRERVTKDEVLSAIRGSGIGELDDVAAVVMETDGSIHVLRGTNTAEKFDTLEGVRRHSS